VRSLIREHIFGLPDRLETALASYGQGREVALEPQGIALGTRIDWSCWGRIGAQRNERPDALLGFSAGRSGYQAHWRSVPALAALTRTTTQRLECDIRDVDGLAACKSPLAPHATLDSFAQAHCQHLIAQTTPEALDRLLAWNEIRILRGGDFFQAFAYEPDRLFLCNAGGGHHFAAARYVAGRLGAPVPLGGRLVLVELDEDAVAALLREFEIFVLDPGVGSDAAVREVALTDGLQAINATYYLRSLPMPMNHCRAVFLPRGDARSLRAVEAFRRAGVTDLGLHLAGLAQAQRAEPRWARSRLPEGDCPSPMGFG